MKLFKNACVIVLCVAMAMLLFSGCETPTVTDTPTPGPSGPTEITSVNAGETYRILIWNNYKENQFVDGTNGSRGEAIRTRWLDYQELYGITITYIAAASTWLEDAQSTAAALEPMCEIFHCGGPFTVPLMYGYGGMQGSIISALSDYADAGDFSDNDYWDVSAQQNVGTFQDKQYFAIPQELGFGQVAFNQVTFFNKSLVQNGGYTAEELYELSRNGEWTFDKLREVSLNCTDVDRGIYGMHVGQNTCAVFAMVAGNDGAYIENKDGIPTCNATDKKVIEAIEFFLTMARDDKSVYLEGNPGSDDDHPTFVNQKHALMITYANRGEKMYEEESISYGVLMPPKGPSADDYISDRNWYTPYCVMKNTQNTAGCVQILSQYIRPEFASSSSTAQDIFEAETSVYFSDEGSIQTLRDVQSKTRNSSVMSYISMTYSGQGLGYYLFGETQNWINGSSTPSEHFAAVENTINALLESAIGIQQ